MKAAHYIAIFLFTITMVTNTDAVCCSKKGLFGCCGNGACNIFCCNCDGGCNDQCEKTSCSGTDWLECSGTVIACAAACVVTEGAACAECMGPLYAMCKKCVVGNNSGNGYHDNKANYEDLKNVINLHIRNKQAIEKQRTAMFNDAVSTRDNHTLFEF